MMGKNVGHWNPVEPDVVSYEFAGVTLQVWLALLIVCPNKTGVFSLFTLDLRKVVSKIRKAKTKSIDIEIALKNLESKGWIKRYPNNIVWIVDRWNYVGNRDNKNTIRNAEKYVAVYPTVWRHFREHYHIQCNDTVIDTVNDSVADSVNNSVGNKGEGEGEGEGKGNKNSDTSKDMSGFPDEYFDFINEIFPKQFQNASLDKQVDALDKIIRLDREKVNPEIQPERWKQVVFNLLKDARQDEGNDSFPGYKVVFQSVVGLRKNNSTKLKNMYWALKQRKGKTKKSISETWADDPTGGY